MIRTLSWLRMREFATHIADPLAATLMMVFGAEVINMELPKVEDPARNYALVYQKNH